MGTNLTQAREERSARTTAGCLHSYPVHTSVWTAHSLATTVLLTECSIECSIKYSIECSIECSIGLLPISRTVLSSSACTGAPAECHRLLLSSHTDHHCSRRHLLWPVTPSMLIADLAEPQSTIPLTAAPHEVGRGPTRHVMSGCVGGPTNGSERDRRASGHGGVLIGPSWASCEASASLSIVGVASGRK